MIQWSDDGIVLDCRKHGESSVVLSVLTAFHGRFHGLLRNAGGKGARGGIQPGNRVRVDWQARLPEHLGNFRCELVDAAAVAALSHPLQLAGLSAARALCLTALPERSPCQPVYDGFNHLLSRLGREDWVADYVRWERDLLTDLGFGLDLGHCAVTGQTEDLVHVSPRSGRAVSREAGAPYRERLLALPPFLREDGGGTVPSREDIAQGLALTGFFLKRCVYDPDERPTPAARSRFVSMVT